MTLLKLTLTPIKLFSTLQIKKLRPRKVNLLAPSNKIKTSYSQYFNLTCISKTQVLNYEATVEWMHIDNVGTF